MNIETKKADILARANAEIAKAEKEIILRENLPIEPKSVHIYPLYGAVASVSYKAENKAQAYEISRQFNILPPFICRDSSVSIKPFDDEKAREVSEIFAWVDVDQHQAKLKFYTMVGSDLIRVDVELPISAFGHYRKSDNKAKINFTMDWQPLPKTCEMFQAVRYARTYHRGPQSGNSIVYALYDPFELENQFQEVEE